MSTAKERVKSAVDGDTRIAAKGSARLRRGDLSGLAERGGQAAKRKPRMRAAEMAEVAMVAPKGPAPRRAADVKKGGAKGTAKTRQRSTLSEAKAAPEHDRDAPGGSPQNLPPPPAKPEGKWRFPDDAQFGNNIRLVRERCGMSQQAVAGALGLPRTAVTNMENGKRSVSTTDMTGLAELFGCRVHSFLEPHAKVSMADLSAEVRRKLPELTDSERIDPGVRRFIGMCNDGVGLRKSLGLEDELTAPSYTANARKVGDAIRQGEAVARKERLRLGLGSDPIPNIAGIVCDQGIWLAEAELPDSLSGLFLNHPSVGLAILVNRGHSRTRKPFSIAHEYARALFDRADLVTATRNGNPSRLAEIRANAFAAAFLVPSDGISDRLGLVGKGRPSRSEMILFDVAAGTPVEKTVRTGPGTQKITYKDVAVLAHHFCVSYEAMLWRLQSVGQVGAGERKSLSAKSDFGRRYIEMLDIFDTRRRAGAEDDPEREIRGRIMSMAIEAYRREEISRGRLLEIGRRMPVDERTLYSLAIRASEP